MPLRIFNNDERGFHEWKQDNPDGYVINSYRRISPSYMVLHQAKCIKLNEANKIYTLNDYIKICSKNPTELIDWIKKQGGEEPSIYCGKCKPKNSKG